MATADRLMSVEWISGEERMSNVLTKTAASLMTRIIVGSVFNSRNVQNKSNAEGYLKAQLWQPYRKFKQICGFLWCQIRHVHTWQRKSLLLEGSVRNEPNRGYATSRGFGLHIFPHLLSVSFHSRVKKRCRGCSWFSSNRTIGSGTSSH